MWNANATLLQRLVPADAALLRGLQHQAVTAQAPFLEKSTDQKIH